MGSSVSRRSLKNRRRRRSHPAPRGQMIRKREQRRKLKRLPRNSRRNRKLRGLRMR